MTAVGMRFEAVVPCSHAILCDFAKRRRAHFRNGRRPASPTAGTIFGQAERLSRLTLRQEAVPSRPVGDSVGGPVPESRRRQDTDRLRAMAPIVRTPRRKTGCVPLCSQPIARAAITPPQAESAVSAVPQAMSTATMEGCHWRITVQLVSS